ncbi:MAG TPA: DNA-directed RNA polymerase subunit D [Candidatus Thermoplasmatota archaeon]
MKIEVLELEKTHARLLMRDTSTALVNALRRTLIADVPKMAIEDVEFHLGTVQDESGKEFESLSPMFDEILAHRLGMVPIPTDLDLFVRRDQCTCSGVGCPNCTIMFVLNKKGPCTVYSGDLEPIGDAKLRVIDDLIPLVKLGEGQAPLIYATAQLGIGREHAKWSPVAGLGFYKYPKLTFHHSRVDDAEGLAKSCPRDLLQVQDGKVTIPKPEDCPACGACVEAGEGAVDLDFEQGSYVFFFETDGSITALRALKEAMKALRARFEGFEKVSPVPAV